MYVSYDQQNWASLLAQAEFCYNFTPHSVTGVSPFKAIHGFNPRRTMMEPITDTNIVGNAEEGRVLVKDLIELHRYLHDHLLEIQQGYKLQYDQDHCPATFEVGDSVLLSMKNIHTVRTLKKLDLRYLSPFKIIKKVNDNAFRLELPKHFRIHDVFEVSLLKKPVVPGVPPMEPAIVTSQLADHQEYEHESILNEKMGHHTRQ